MSGYTPPPPETTTIKLGIGALADSFGRHRVSDISTLLDVKMIYDKQPLLYDELVAAGAAATHLPNESAVSMDVTATIGSRIVRQTFRYVPYQPGKSRVVYMTGNLARGGVVTGVRSRIGPFDEHADKDTAGGYPGGGNGHFFELDETGAMFVCERSYVTGTQVDARIPQASWNLDTLDGSGDANNPSGITFDPTKAHLFRFDIAWLATGCVRVGVVSAGETHYVHFFKHENVVETAYMTSATLPLRYELENVSAAAAGKMTQICSTVQSEGGFNPRGAIFSRSSEVTSKAIGDAAYMPLISIRAKQLRNRITINPLAIEIVQDVGDIYNWQVHQGVTLTAPVWVSAHANSSVEFDVAATGFSGGFEAAAGYISDKSRFAKVTEFESGVLPGANIAGETQVLTLIARRATGTGTKPLFGAIQWQEWE